MQSIGLFVTITTSYKYMKQNMNNRESTITYIEYLEDKIEDALSNKSWQSAYWYMQTRDVEIRFLATQEEL